MSRPQESKVFKELGKRIADGRRAKRWSQERLAGEAELDRSHIGFIEQGRRRPTIPTLIRICKKLDMSLEKLFKGF